MTGGHQRRVAPPVEAVAGGLTVADLDRFRAVQRLAYDCVETVAATLEPGVTERETAQRMRRWLEARGVDDWFHLPFAWFGDRTAFRHFRVGVQFFPSQRRLGEGMAYILDCAPVVDSYTADIGYAGCLGYNPVVERLIDDLAGYRSLILDLVRQRCSLRRIYESVDARLASQGYENCHRVYPGSVLGHRLERVHSRLPRLYVARFGLRSLVALEADLLRQRWRGWSPLWAGGAASDHPPTPGLWAVEPHLALGDVGVKFEEILVVGNDDAWWLDDDLPHVRRWARRRAEAVTPV